MRNPVALAVTMFAGLVAALMLSTTPASAVTSDSPAYSWGYGSSGQLGNNANANSGVPTGVDTSGLLAGKTLTTISAGYAHACALSAEGVAYCWGDGSNGRLGNGATANSSVPVAVNMGGVLAGKTLTAISAGRDHTCALASDGAAYCWGRGFYGQLGDNTTNDSSVPVAVTMTGVLLGKLITAISAAGSYTCALASDGAAYCWGIGGIGQLGNGATSDSSVPVAVNMGGALAGKTLTTIDAAVLHTCAVASDGAAFCWGNNGNGQLGNGSTTPSSVPVAVNMGGVLAGKTLAVISGGQYHTCGLSSDGAAYCWGYGFYGELGNNANVDSSVPVAVFSSGVLADKTLTAIASGGNHTCVLASDGSASCWGVGGSGQLGDGASTSSNVPVVVSATGLPLGKVFTAISAGDSFTAALVGDPGASDSSGVAAAASVPVYTFVFRLPDGRECGAISPAAVRGGSFFTLPGDDADCRTPGSLITGWTIPGQDWPLRPGRTVAVIDSQTFTAVLKEPTVTVRYDANVASVDACLGDGATDTRDRAVSERVDRVAIGVSTSRRQSACAPAGHVLAGWMHRPSRTMLAPGQALPLALVSGGGEYPVNAIELYAVWSPISRS